MIWSQQYLEDQVAAGTRIVIKSAGFVPYSKTPATAPLPPTSLISREDVGDVLAGNAELRAIFGSIPFNHPKPTTLVKFLVNAVTHSSPDALVLDFFAGSGTTAEAVSALNIADGGRRRTISVNLPEPVPADSVARQLGYETVADVALDRILRVMEASPPFKEEGLRVYRLATSSFRSDIGADPANRFDLSDTTLIDPDLSPEAIAAEVLLKEGVVLTEPWTRSEADGDMVIEAGGVAIVLSLEITERVVAEALALESRVVVFLEDGFAGSDAIKANAVTNARNLNITLKTV